MVVANLACRFLDELYLYIIDSEYGITPTADPEGAFVDWQTVVVDIDFPVIDPIDHSPPDPVTSITCNITGILVPVISPVPNCTSTFKKVWATDAQTVWAISPTQTWAIK